VGRGLWSRLFGDPSVQGNFAFLRKVFLFRELNDRALAPLSRALMEKTYAEGETVFDEGDVGRACFIVVKGRVQLTRLNKATGAPEKVAVFGPEEFFGELVLLDELPRSATARVLEPATLLILYKSTFDALLESSPRTASLLLHRLARLLSARLRRDNVLPSVRPGVLPLTGT